MRRREFITILGGAAIAWPLSAHAQQTERVRRIGVLSGTAPGDQETQDRIAAFQQRLQQLGWIDGRNMRIDHRVWAGDLALARRYAAELVALAPDAILAGGGTSLRCLLEATSTVPIVFANVTDPVGCGHRPTIQRPMPERIPDSS